MIKIGKDYRLHADKYQYILEIRKDGKDKDGNHKDQWSQSYYPKISQVCSAIANDLMIDEVNSKESLLDAFNAVTVAVNELTSAIEKVEEGK